MVDFNYFLNRKYNILQQQANQGDVTAAATKQNAATNALTGAASAALDRTRNQILPGQAAAEIGLTGAQTRLTNEQASIVAPESRARIANVNSSTGLNIANTGLVNTQNSVQRFEGLGFTDDLAPTVRDAIERDRQSLLGSRQVRLSEITPTRRTPTATGRLAPRRSGESEAAYLDRINGL